MSQYMSIENHNDTGKDKQSNLQDPYAMLILFDIFYGILISLMIYIDTYFIDNSTNELEQTSPSGAKEIRQLKKNVEVNSKYG